MRLSGLVLLLAMAVAGCGGGDGAATPTTPTAPSANVPFSTVDVRVGTGAEANTGRTVAVNYTGWLYSATATDNKGTQFDSSLAAGRTPLIFTVGTGVIAGFSQGAIGMRVGGIRRVIIPPSLGYGSQANGSIPGNSTLVFEIELLAVQ